MTLGGRRSFGAQLEALREAAGYTQEELATIAGLSVHAVSALERGERRRPPVETVRALSAALDLTGAIRDAFVGSTRACKDTAAVDELSGVSQPQALTAILGRDARGADAALLRLLVTSRAPLHVRGEREYAVGPLALEVVSSSRLYRQNTVNYFSPKRVNL